MVARSRIELPTQGFSGLCSTTELPRHILPAYLMKKRKIRKTFLKFIGQILERYENKEKCDSEL